MMGLETGTSFPKAHLYGYVALALDIIRCQFHGRVSASALSASSCVPPPRDASIGHRMLQSRLLIIHVSSKGGKRNR